MEQEKLPEWEPQLIDEAITTAASRLEQENKTARKRALQLARERAYHRLAVAIDRPGKPQVGPAHLTLFPADPTLFDA